MHRSTWPCLLLVVAACRSSRDDARAAAPTTPYDAYVAHMRTLDPMVAQAFRVPPQRELPIRELATALPGIRLYQIDSSPPDDTGRQGVMSMQLADVGGQVLADFSTEDDGHTHFLACTAAYRQRAAAIPRGAAGDEARRALAGDACVDFTAQVAALLASDQDATVIAGLAAVAAIEGRGTSALVRSAVQLSGVPWRSPPPPIEPPTVTRHGAAVTIEAFLIDPDHLDHARVTVDGGALTIDRTTVDTVVQPMQTIP